MPVGWQRDTLCLRPRVPSPSPSFVRTGEDLKIPAESIELVASSGSTMSVVSYPPYLRHRLFFYLCVTVIVLCSLTVV